MLLERIKRVSHFLALAAIVFGVGAFYETNAAGVIGSTAAAFVDDDDDRKKNRGRRSDRGDRRGRGDDSQRDSDREARRQQRESDRNSRRQQEWSDRNSRRQQWESDRESRRQQYESDRKSRRQQWESDNRNRDRGRYDRRRNDERRVIYVSPQGYFGTPWNVSRVYRDDNRRFAREQKRFPKEQRKAQRRYEKDRRRNLSSQYGGYTGPVYRYENNYYPDQSAYRNGSSWKDQILPMLMANIFGGGGSEFLSNSFPGRPDRDGYDYRHRRSTYVYQPSYSGSYDGDALYSYGPTALDTGSVLNALPIAELIERYTGENEFVSGLIGSFLTQGYDQGLIAGQAARQNGFTDENYNDPYTYQNGAYDPYSVSLGENRRYLSEGYEQGYRDGYEQGSRDAIAGNEQLNQVNAGESDLVGVLLNSVLSGG